MSEKKVNKKKVSFDIEVKNLEEIKSYCKKNDIKFSDFYRDAANEKFLRDNKNLTVYYFDDTENKILTFNVNSEEYQIIKFSINEETKANLGINNIVKISKKNDDFNDSILDKLLEKNNNLLKCFEK